MILDINTSLYEIIRKFEIAKKKKISEIKVSVEITQSDQHGEKYLAKINKTPENCGAIFNRLIYVQMESHKAK